MRTNTIWGKNYDFLSSTAQPFIILLPWACFCWAMCLSRHKEEDHGDDDGDQQEDDHDDQEEDDHGNLWKEDHDQLCLFWW